jgi:hypothetical protein
MNRPVRPLICSVIAALTWMGSVFASAPSHADAAAYLVNVTVRPGYKFANAEQALAYGQSLCDRLAAGEGYSGLIRVVKDDFRTPQDYQASYLINQAAQELCPAMIWHLRNTAAADYQPEDR